MPLLQLLGLRHRRTLQRSYQLGKNRRVAQRTCSKLPLSPTPATPAPSTPSPVISSGLRPYLRRRERGGERWSVRRRLSPRRCEPSVWGTRRLALPCESIQPAYIHHPVLGDAGDGDPLRPGPRERRHCGGRGVRAVVLRAAGAGDGFGPRHTGSAQQHSRSERVSLRALGPCHSARSRRTSRRRARRARWTAAW